MKLYLRSTSYISVALLFLATALMSLPTQPTASASDNDYTWTQATGLHNMVGDTQLWTAIASSADGTKLAAATRYDSIYTSTDSGVTWTEQTAAGEHEWISITSSADGTKLAAVADGDYIYTSTDSGVTWTEQTAAGSRGWTSIASSADGTKLAAIGFDEDTYSSFVLFSSDSGSRWSSYGFNIDIDMDNGIISGPYLLQVLISTDGNALMVGGADMTVNMNTEERASSGFIIVSKDFGGSWSRIDIPSSRGVSTMSASSDFSTLAVAGLAMIDRTDHIFVGTLNQQQTPPDGEGPDDGSGSSDGGGTDGAPGNGNSSPTRSNVAHLQTPSSSIAKYSNKPVKLATPTNTNITASSTVSESSFSTQDDTYEYPLGLVDFSFTTDQADNNVTLSFATDLKPNQVKPRKYKPCQPQLFPNVSLDLLMPGSSA